MPHNLIRIAIFCIWMPFSTFAAWKGASYAQNFSSDRLIVEESAWYDFKMSSQIANLQHEAIDEKVFDNVEKFYELPQAEKKDMVLLSDRAFGDQNAQRGSYLVSGVQDRNSNLRDSKLDIEPYEGEPLDTDQLQLDGAGLVNTTSGHMHTNSTAWDTSFAESSSLSVVATQPAVSSVEVTWIATSADATSSATAIAIAGTAASASGDSNASSAVKWPSTDLVGQSSSRFESSARSNPAPSDTVVAASSSETIAASASEVDTTKGLQTYAAERTGNATGPGFTQGGLLSSSARLSLAIVTATPTNIITGSSTPDQVRWSSALPAAARTTAAFSETAPSSVTGSRAASSFSAGGRAQTSSAVSLGTSSRMSSFAAKSTQTFSSPYGSTVVSSSMPASRTASAAMTTVSPSHPAITSAVYLTSASHAAAASVSESMNSPLVSITSSPPSSPAAISLAGGTVAREAISPLGFGSATATYIPSSPWTAAVSTVATISRFAPQATTAGLGAAETTSLSPAQLSSSTPYASSSSISSAAIEAIVSASGPVLASSSPSYSSPTIVSSPLYYAVNSATVSLQSTPQNSVWMSWNGSTSGSTAAANHSLSPSAPSGLLWTSYGEITSVESPSPSATALLGLTEPVTTTISHFTSSTTLQVRSSSEDADASILPSSVLSKTASSWPLNLQTESFALKSSLTPVPLQSKSGNTNVGAVETTSNVFSAEFVSSSDLQLLKEQTEEANSTYAFTTVTGVIGDVSSNLSSASFVQSDFSLTNFSNGTSVDLSTLATAQENGSDSSMTSQDFSEGMIFTAPNFGGFTSPEEIDVPETNTNQDNQVGYWKRTTAPSELLNPWTDDFTSAISDSSPSSTDTVAENSSMLFNSSELLPGTSGNESILFRSEQISTIAQVIISSTTSVTNIPQISTEIGNHSRSAFSQATLPRTDPERATTTTGLRTSSHDPVTSVSDGTVESSVESSSLIKLLDMTSTTIRSGGAEAEVTVGGATVQISTASATSVSSATVTALYSPTTTLSTAGDFPRKILSGLEMMGPVEVLMDSVSLGIPPSDSMSRYRPFDDFEIIIPAGAWTTSRRQIQEPLVVTIFKPPSNFSFPGRACGLAIDLAPHRQVLAKQISVSLPCNASYFESDIDHNIQAFRLDPETSLWVTDVVSWNGSSSNQTMWAKTQNLGTHLALMVSIPQNRSPSLEVGAIVGVTIGSAVLLSVFTFIFRRSFRCGSTVASMARTLHRRRRVSIRLGFYAMEDGNLVWVDAVTATKDQLKELSVLEPLADIRISVERESMSEPVGPASPETSRDRNNVAIDNMNTELPMSIESTPEKLAKNLALDKCGDLKDGIASAFEKLCKPDVADQDQICTDWSEGTLCSVSHVSSSSIYSIPTNTDYFSKRASLCQQHEELVQQAMTDCPSVKTASLSSQEEIIWDDVLLSTDSDGAEIVSKLDDVVGEGSIVVASETEQESRESEADEWPATPLPALHSEDFWKYPLPTIEEPPYSEDLSEPATLELDPNLNFEILRSPPS